MNENNNLNEGTNDVISSNMQFNNEKTYQQSKKNVNKKLFIAIPVALALIVLLVFLIKGIFTESSSLVANDGSEISSSFFIKNNNGMYALFNTKGKRLTDFKFNRVESFSNDSVLVRNKDGKDAIISSSGKTVVDFGTYKRIRKAGSLYLATDKDYNNFVINSKGKVLFKDKDIYATAYIENKPITVVEYKGVYYFYNYKEKLLKKIPISEDKNVDSPTSYEFQNYIVMFYNNTNYVIDNNKQKIVLSFNDKYSYGVYDINEKNNDEIILSARDENENLIFKYVKNNKIMFTKQEPSYDYRTADYTPSLKFEGNNIVYNFGRSCILDQNGNVLSKFPVSGLNYKDAKNYVAYDNNTLNVVDLYVDGKLNKKIKCSEIDSGKYTKYDAYILERCSYENNKYNTKMLVTTDGTIINNKGYKKAHLYYEDGVAVVSDDGETYYLINLKGKKLSKDYAFIKDFKDGFYIATKQDETRVILNSKGEELLTGKKFEYYDYRSYFNVIDDNKYIIYNISKFKKVAVVNVDSNSKLDLNNNYFTISKDSKTQYYSYKTGKMFYEN